MTGHLYPPTDDDVLAALELIAARVPDRHVTPDRVMVAAWSEDLRRHPRTAVLRAALEWSTLTFPSVTEFVEVVVEVARADLLAEQAAVASGTEVPVACPEGCDDGWFDENPTNTLGTVRPCRGCRPIEYAMWLHRTTPGHDPDHCGDCIGLRQRTKVVPRWLTSALDADAMVRRRGVVRTPDDDF